MSIESTNKVNCYEIDGKEPRGSLELPQLIVASHWNYRDRVVLTFPSGKSITVISSDLIAAINNSTNRGSY